MGADGDARVFKTAWFAKAARKVRIHDTDLCSAIAEAIAGQAVDLGGGVYKKRLNRNEHRSIILAKGGSYWVYEFPFAKKDMSNISPSELQDFRALAKAYASLSGQQMDRLLRDGDLTEICHDGQA